MIQTNHLIFTKNRHFSISATRFKSYLAHRIELSPDAKLMYIGTKNSSKESCSARSIMLGVVDARSLEVLSGFRASNRSESPHRLQAVDHVFEAFHFARPDPPARRRREPEGPDFRGLLGRAVFVPDQYERRSNSQATSWSAI